MAQVSRAVSKTRFETGDIPTEDHFVDFHDSAYWKGDDDPLVALREWDAAVAYPERIGVIYSGQRIFISKSAVAAGVEPTVTAGWATYWQEFTAEIITVTEPTISTCAQIKAKTNTDGLFLRVVFSGDTPETFQWYQFHPAVLTENLPYRINDTAGNGTWIAAGGKYCDTIRPNILERFNLNGVASIGAATFNATDAFNFIKATGATDIVTVPDPGGSNLGRTVVIHNSTFGDLSCTFRHNPPTSNRTAVISSGEVVIGFFSSGTWLIRKLTDAIDTRWRVIGVGGSPAFASNMAAPSTGPTLRFRKVEGVVEITGHCETSASSNGEAFTLPIGFWPAVEIRAPFTLSSSSNGYHNESSSERIVTISTGGVVTFESPAGVGLNWTSGTEFHTHFQFYVG